MTELGDRIAKQAFKEEIVKRYKKGNFSVKTFLLKEGYMTHLTKEELIYGILNTKEQLVMEEISRSP